MKEEKKYMKASEWFKRAKKLHNKTYKDFETFKKHCEKVFKKGYFVIDYFSEDNLFIVQPNLVEEGGRPENHVFYLPFYKEKKDRTLEKIDTEAKVSELAPILAEAVDRKELIRDVLRKLSPERITEIYDRVITHKAKVKQKPGCVYLSIGGKRGAPGILMLRD